MNFIPRLAKSIKISWTTYSFEHNLTITTLKNKQIKMKEQFWAHSENNAGEPHLLEAHLRKTSKLAAEYAATPAPAAIACSQNNSSAHHRENIFVLLASLAGWLHDLGKYLKEFQHYLRQGGVRGSVPHARWGAIAARVLGQQEISFAVNGHHSGLQNKAVWEYEHTAADGVELKRCLELLKNFLSDAGLSEQILAAPQPEGLSLLERDVLTRFIFSCLIDADWLDTEAHFSPGKSALRRRGRLDIDLARQRLATQFAQFAGAPDPSGINKLRTDARLSALQKARMPAGFFSLNLPTGLGKTLTSFQWAVEHAAANNLERIIIVLPYVNIIDQTVLALRKLLGEEAVLEHHSGYTPPSDGSKDHATQEREDMAKAACENWDAGIIVTTGVQFYETLFSNARGKCRKLHNIANSVVILDEVQTLNKDLVLPTLDMLRDIQALLNVSFVFCSATLPAFAAREEFPGVERIVELVDNAGTLFSQTVRVRFEQLNELAPLPLESLQKHFEASEASTLVVLNTKKPAAELYLALRNSPQWDRVYYLTTNLCPHHRKRLVKEIPDILRQGKERILVLSTQLIEAGVDLDFPCVFRELAPLESVIQAAGRCNREGLLPAPGRVVLFRLENGKFPDSSYKAQAQHVYNLLVSGTANLYDYSFFQEYYQQILSLFITQKQAITREREKQNFTTVAEQYRLIPQATTPLFIQMYNEESKSLYNTLKFKEKQAIKLSMEDYRIMQQYSVQVYDNFFTQSQGLWSEFACGIRVWDGGYDEGLGLDIGVQYTDTRIL